MDKSHGSWEGIDFGSPYNELIVGALKRGRCGEGCDGIGYQVADYLGTETVQLTASDRKIITVAVEHSGVGPEIIKIVVDSVLATRLIEQRLTD